MAAKVIIYPGDLEEYFTFVTPEAYSSLEEWMKFRSEYGEKITGESWLMRDVWQTSNMEYGAKFGLATNPKKLKSVAITRLLERAWEQGVRKKLPDGCKRHPWKAAHGWRTWFKTNAQLAGMDSLNVEFLMGHDIGLGESYFKPTEQEMLKEYLKIVGQLTINNETQKIQKKVAELQKRSSDNENILRAKLQEKDEQLEKILERQDDLEVQFMEILRIAKLKDGWIGKDKTVLDKDRKMITKYVDDSNKIRTLKIPIDAVEIK